MAIAVTFTPAQGSPGSTPGTVSAAITGLTTTSTWNFTVVGPSGTYTQKKIAVAGTTYTLVFPVNDPGQYTVYTEGPLAAAAAAIASGTYTNSATN